MYRFLQKHGKKVFAVFSAILMISFALPSMTGNSGGGRSNPVVGTVDGQKVRAQEVYNAKQAWDILSRTRMPAGQQGSAPLIFMLGPAAAEEINSHPTMFYLLQKEAEKMGVTYD